MQLTNLKISHIHTKNVKDLLRNCGARVRTSEQEEAMHIRAIARKLHFSLARASAGLIEREKNFVKWDDTRQATVNHALNSINFISFSPTGSTTFQPVDLRLIISFSLPYIKSRPLSLHMCDDDIFEFWGEREKFKKAT